MRTIVIGALIALAAGQGALAQGSHYVSGYTKQDGTYVAPHYQTNPNNTVNDNYSTKPNVNPYTGQEGTKPAQPFGYVPQQAWQPAWQPAPPQTEQPRQLQAPSWGQPLRQRTYPF